MLLKIEFESEIPIYIQLKNSIIDGIAKGELKEGDSLPSVRQLASDIGINLHTVNKAYNLLRDDGFVIMDRRKGAVIGKNSSMLSEEFKEKLGEEIRPVIAESYCRGMTKEEFMSICSKIFDSYCKEK